jgi:hypothetical protein
MSIQCDWVVEMGLGLGLVLTPQTKVAVRAGPVALPRTVPLLSASCVNYFCGPSLKYSSQKHLVSQFWCVWMDAVSLCGDRVIPLFSSRDQSFPSSPHFIFILLLFLHAHIISSRSLVRCVRCRGWRKVRLVGLGLGWSVNPQPKPHRNCFLR